MIVIRQFSTGQYVSDQGVQGTRDERHIRDFQTAGCAQQFLGLLMAGGGWRVEYKPEGGNTGRCRVVGCDRRCDSHPAGHNEAPRFDPYCEAHAQAC